MVNIASSGSLLAEYNAVLQWQWRHSWERYKPFSSNTDLAHDGCDNGQIQAMFREGFIANSALSAGDDTAAYSNITTFYAANSSPPACLSTIDYHYFFGYNMQNAQQSISDTRAEWGLRQMRAKYWGPIADLRDATGTVRTFSAALSGCALDPAAATFCAAHSPCTVAQLYNQGIVTIEDFNQPDGWFNMGSASTGAQPRVDFNNLDDKPTMHFSGTQLLCTPDQGITFLDTPPIVMSAVARRTSVSGATEVVLGTQDNNPSVVGFAAAAGAGYFAANGSATVPAAVNTWHQLYWEAAPSTNASAYVDGVFAVTLPTPITNFVWQNHTCIGGWHDGTMLLTGDVAEAIIGSGSAPAASGFASPETALFALQEAAWGTPP